MLKQSVLLLLEVKYLCTHPLKFRFVFSFFCQDSRAAVEVDSKRVKKLEKQVKELTADKESYQGKLQLSMTNFKKLQKDFEDLRKTNSDLEAKVGSNASSDSKEEIPALEKLEKELKEKEEELVFSQNQYMKASSTIKQEKRKAGDFKLKLQIACKKFTDLKEENAKLNKDLKQLVQKREAKLQATENNVSPPAAAKQTVPEINKDEIAPVPEKQSPSNRRTRLSTKRHSSVKDEKSIDAKKISMESAAVEVAVTAESPIKKVPSIINTTIAASQEKQLETSETTFAESKSPSPGRRVTRLSKRRYSRDPSTDVGHQDEESTQVGTKRTLRHLSESQEAKRSKNDLPSLTETEEEVSLSQSGRLT